MNRPGRGPTALSGTPGTGKSAVAARLGPPESVVEVADLAVRLGVGERRGRTVVVDLGGLRRALSRPRGWGEVRVVVGHLAHLLPVRGSIVLRCRPTELARRLAGRGTPSDRRANVVCEATDVVLLEAIGTGRPVWEIDTTGRGVEAVTRAVRYRLARGGPSRVGVVDWLADRAVTAELLRRAP